MLNFSAVRLAITDDAYILSAATPLTTLSSAVVGGGFQQSCTILNRHVPLNYDCSNPVDDLQQFASALNITGLFVGMLTGVPMSGTRVVNVRDEDLSVSSIITAGVSNAVTSGVSKPAPLKPGTVNIVILVDANLIPAAMVNAVITATEAKANVLMECGVKSSEGDVATGTSTDAIVIACSGRGAPLLYAGPGTDVGYLIGRSVHECLIQALEPCSIFYPERVLREQ